MSQWQASEQFCLITKRSNAVEELLYKPEGRGFDSQLCYWNFTLIVALGSIQTLTEMSARNISWGGGAKASGA